MKYPSGRQYSDMAILYTLAQTVEAPTAHDKTLLAALMMRYQNHEFADTIQTIVKSWGLTSKELLHQVRAIWANGFKPEDLSEPGSSWDSNSQEDDQ